MILIICALDFKSVVKKITFVKKIDLWQGTPLGNYFKLTHSENHTDFIGGIIDGCPCRNCIRSR
jgi:hypothetical protein